MELSRQSYEVAGEDIADNIFSRFSLDQLRQRASEKWRCYDPDVVPLWIAEMDVPLTDAVGEELKKIVASGDTGYESPADAQRYLEAYKGFAARRWNADIDVTHGRTMLDVISGLRAAVVATLGQRPLNNTGDEVGNEPSLAVIPGAEGVEVPSAKYQGTVVVQTPIYPPFLHRLPQDYSLAISPLTETTHRTDFDSLEAVFKHLTEGSQEKRQSLQPSSSGYDIVFVLCSPHNPFGTVFDAEELTRIAQLCEKYHVRLLVDEIHSPIVVSSGEGEAADESRAEAEPSSESRLGAKSSSAFVPILSLPAASKAIVSVSASKGFSLPGFKAALLIPGTDPEAIETVESITNEEAAPGAHVATNVHAAAFERGDEWADRMLSGLAQNERIFRTLMESLLPKARVNLGRGTYLAFVDFSAYVTGTKWDGRVSEALCEEARVAFNPGDTFGGNRWNNFVRINLATNPLVITEAVKRAAEFIKEL